MKSASLLAALVLSLVPVCVALPGAGGYGSGPGVSVAQLSVNGRFDSPLGLDDIHPTLAWQIVQNGECDDDVCHGDRQTAYEVQAAATVEELQAGTTSWDTVRVKGGEQQVRFDGTLASRDTIAWRVRVWDASDQASDWSEPSTWTIGLLEQSDWGEARWISYPDRKGKQPLPLLVRQFDVPESEILSATLYLSGIGLMHPTVNGEEITDEVLAPAYSNYQLSNEYRTYDVAQYLRSGANAIGVSPGNGVAYVRRDNLNPAVGRNAPYAWWQSTLQADGNLVAGAEAGSTSVRVNNVTLYHLGGTIDIDTADGGQKLESRVITSVNNRTNTVEFTPGLELDHANGVNVTGSGDNIAATDPTAGAAVLPRLIGRLELSYTDGSSDTIVTDRSWLSALGPLVTDVWYSGPDYDARRELEGWNQPGADLSSDEWVSAGFVPPPNLATQLVARAAEPVKIQEGFNPVSVNKPFPGIWVFDFGQNFAGWAQLTLPEMPPGVTIKVAPSESLNANGTIEQSSLGPSTGEGSRGSDLFYTYTTAGRAGGESWHPDFDYFGMQWVQITGLPDDFEPTVDLITGLRLQADVPTAGTFTSSNERVNRVHKMASYSFYSNLLSTFTDCPGREKLSYPADYTQTMGSIYRHFHLSAFMRTTMRTLVEGQSIADTYMFGNVALKTPVYDWGYTRHFGDEINWGNGIVLVPSMLHDLYDDTSVMAAHYDRMIDFVDYIQREKVQDNIVYAPLGDWVEDDNADTSGFITGTWGYYLTIQAMSRMANLTGHVEDAEMYAALAPEIRRAFNAAFFDDRSGQYRNNGSTGVSNATQAAQALALDSGLVEEANRQTVLQALVNLTNAYGPANETGPHISGGTIGMAPIVRALSAGGYDDVLWEFLQQNEQPSYGYFLAPTTQNPSGLTTIPENWDISASKNHMILAHIEEWFHAGLAGIKPLALSTFSPVEEDGLVFEPKIVGGLTSAEATYLTMKGSARSQWTLGGEGAFVLEVTVPPNTRAEVRVPGSDVQASGRAERVGEELKYVTFSVPSGTHRFTSTLKS